MPRWEAVALGDGLQRIQRANQEATNSIRELGKRLAVTDWQFAPEFKIVPYIDNECAGEPPMETPQRTAGD